MSAAASSSGCLLSWRSSTTRGVPNDVALVFVAVAVKRVCQATSLALKSFPMLNATTDAEATQVVHRGAHNIGIAMDTPRGLLVPNVKHVEVCWCGP